MNKNNLLRQIRLADLVLVFVVIITIAISYKGLSLNSSDAVVRIYKNNSLWGEYQLSEDKIIKIDSHNTVEIRHNKVGMIESDCPDKRCVKQGFTDKLPIICLPNHLLVEVYEKEKDRILILQ